MVAEKLKRNGINVQWPLREELELIVDDYKRRGQLLSQLAYDYGVERVSLSNKLSTLGIEYGYIGSNKYDIPPLDQIQREYKAAGVTLREWCRGRGLDFRAYKAIVRRFNRVGVNIVKHKTPRTGKKCFFTIEVPEKVGDDFKALFGLGNNPSQYLRSKIKQMVESGELL